MIITLEDVRKRLAERGVSLAQGGRYVERLDAILRQRFPDLVGWTYDEVRDVLTLDLPDPPQPDTSAFGRRRE